MEGTLPKPLVHFEPVEDPDLVPFLYQGGGDIIDPDGRGQDVFRVNAGVEKRGKRYDDPHRTASNRILNRMLTSGRAKGFICIAVMKEETDIPITCIYCGGKARIKGR
ncbi:MAG: hypothetical protein K6360_00450 [Deltaproteobacteria bacterium]